MGHDGPVSAPTGPPTDPPAAPATSFSSDNAAGIDPVVLDALVAANRGHATAYGADPWSDRLTEAVRDLLGPDAVVLPTFGGTGANVTALAALVDGWGAVICTDVAHIHVDECGAPERQTGAKLVTVPHVEGKLTPEGLADRLGALGVVHHSQPQVVSLTQSTEEGTCYSVDELAALVDLAHRHGLAVHVDGARIANATAALGVPLRSMITDLGVDVVCLGGTKDGTAYGEAVVTSRPELAERLAFARKQAGQLPSKLRFVAAQLTALLEGDRWIANATHANAMAARLADGLAAVDRVDLVRRPEVNAVFVRLPEPAIDRLIGWSTVYRWAPGVVRVMTSFDTTAADVDRFVAGVAWAVGDP